MRLLFLSHCVPFPPNKGEKTRAYYELKGLGGRHQVDLLAVGKERKDLRHRSSLQELCRRVELVALDRTTARARSVRALASNEPLTLGYFRMKALERRVRQLAREETYDAVVVFSSAMAPYAEPFEEVPKLLDMVDVDSAKWKQYARFARFPMRAIYRLEASRLRRYEAALADRFERIVVTTPRELELLRRIRPDVAAVSIQQGIELEKFQPLERPRAEAPTLVFTGQMDYFANVDGVVHFADAVFPGLRRRAPNLEFLIVGRSPTRAVRALGRIPGVTVTGEVDDVRPYLARAWVFVAPLRIAQGIQNKVLEAMASGLPVVCSQPVLAGLGDRFRPGEELLVGADDGQFGAAVLSLLQDGGQRREMALAARRCVSAGFSWRRSMECFEAELQQVAGTDGSGRVPDEPGATL